MSEFLKPVKQRKINYIKNNELARKFQKLKSVKRKNEMIIKNFQKIKEIIKIKKGKKIL